MYWKKKPIQEYFNDTVTGIRESEKAGPGWEYPHYDHTAFILLRNFDESVEFLTHANKAEIACAVDALEWVVEGLPKDKAQVIVDIFKKKLEEFPDVGEYSLFAYEEEIDTAQYIIDHME